MEEVKKEKRNLIDKAIALLIRLHGSENESSKEVLATLKRCKKEKRVLDEDEKKVFKKLMVIDDEEFAKRDDEDIKIIAQVLHFNNVVK